MLITVHHEVSPWDAHIVMGRLRAEGLHPSLLAEHHISVIWPLSMMLGMVRIQVPLAEAPRAREVLANWRAGIYQEAMEDQLDLPDTAHCPQCGKCDWIPVRGIWSRALACVMVFFWHAGFPPEVIGRRCRACGHAERFNSSAEDAEPSP